MIKLLAKEIFKLGFAYGSFSADEIVQGIHIVLPVTGEDGVKENSVFVSLFEDYFDEVSKLENIKDVGLVYMGAIAAFAVDNQLDLITERASFIEAYKRTIR